LIEFGSYKIAPPLVKPSKLTRKEAGGVGKNLSDGWAINFAIGCTFGCRFCYVDSIHKLYSSPRAGRLVDKDWGYYFATPTNLDEVIEQTPWSRWRGEEVLLSSTHDPYLPQLAGWTRKILEHGLRCGVRFCIQTRSPLVLQDLDLLEKYREQVRVQVSVATFSTELARAIEPRVTTPQRRLDIIRHAREAGLRTGVIIAPILPPCRLRPDVEGDLMQIFDALGRVRPDMVYGETLHIRGMNMTYLANALGEELSVDYSFDQRVGKLFTALLMQHGLNGRYWFGR